LDNAITTKERKESHVYYLTNPEVWCIISALEHQKGQIVNELKRIDIGQDQMFIIQQYKAIDDVRMKLEITKERHEMQEGIRE
jgi:hypothetical protein